MAMRWSVPEATATNDCRSCGNQFSVHCHDCAACPGDSHHSYCKHNPNYGQD